MGDYRVDSLGFSYPQNELRALNDVSLETRKGSITAFLGSNGSGKTTLLKVLLRVLFPDEGKVLLDGRDIQEYGREELSRKIAWVPQEEETSFPYTVAEYMLMGRAPHLGLLSLPSEEDVALIEELLEKLGVVQLRDRGVSNLSGGEERLIMIGRALAQEPDVILIDEPTAHLDLGNKVKVLKVIRELSTSGRTVLFSTHDPNEASMVADAVVVLDEGRVLDTGIPGDVITKDILQTIYKTDVNLVEVDGKPVVDLSINFRDGE